MCVTYILLIASCVPIQISSELLEFEIKTQYYWAGELAQWLRALVVKDPGLFPSTHMEAHLLFGHQVHM